MSSGKILFYTLLATILVGCAFVIIYKIYAKSSIVQATRDLEQLNAVRQKYEIETINPLSENDNMKTNERATRDLEEYDNEDSRSTDEVKENDRKILHIESSMDTAVLATKHSYEIKNFPRNLIFNDCKKFELKSKDILKDCVLRGYDRYNNKIFEIRINYEYINNTVEDKENIICNDKVITLKELNIKKFNVQKIQIIKIINSFKPHGYYLIVNGKSKSIPLYTVSENNSKLTFECLVIEYINYTNNTVLLKLD